MMKKNILIIGASSGIGFDLAKALLKQGHTVYCCARRESRLAELEANGAYTYQVDVRLETNVQNVVQQMVSREGRIDLVYFNAGYAIAGAVEETSVEKVTQQFDTNVFGAARVLRSVLPVLREQQSGRIVLTTSIAARVSTGMNAWYSATKHALNGMAKALAQEVAQFNIDIITVEPGCVNTELPEIQLADMLNTNELEDYKLSTQRSHDFLKKAYANGSDTTSTVNVLKKAGFSVNPKQHYRTTVDSKLMFWLQKIIGEKSTGRLFNRLIALH